MMHAIAVINALHRGQPLAAERECLDPTRSGWVGVYPFDLSKEMFRRWLRNHGFEIFPARGRAFRIRVFEVERRLIETGASIGETELHNARDFMVFNDDDLVKQLSELAVPIERLELHCKSDYPI